MKVLKIKNNVDLHLLEDLGFEFPEESETYMEYYTSKGDYVIDNNRIIRYNDLIYSSCYDKLDNQVDVSCNFEISAIIYYLIKLDFVEIINIEEE